MSNDYPETEFTRSTLFLGNLPHDTNEKDFKAWPNEQINRIYPEDKVDFKLATKILRSGHTAYGKTFKAFGFVEFKKAVYAFGLSLEISKEGCDTWQGRRIPAYPAVLQPYHPADQKWHA